MPRISPSCKQASLGFLLAILPFVLHRLALAEPVEKAATRYGAAVVVAKLENPAVKESSGIAASVSNADIIWTHNDSGDKPFVYAFDRTGKNCGVWKVKGAAAEDWEDMALGPGPKRGQSYLYLGDIGDNLTKREEIVVYRVAEPEISPGDAASTVQEPRETAAADIFRLRYPDGRHNAETLLVHPVTGDLYIITKVSGPEAHVYKLVAPEPKADVQTLAAVGTIRLPKPHLGLITGGSNFPGRPAGRALRPHRRL